MKEQAEEIERLRKLKEQQEEEEYQLLKSDMEVVSSGTDVLDQAAKEARMNEFTNYILQNKVVLLSDLAIEFSLKTPVSIYSFVYGYNLYHVYIMHSYQYTHIYNSNRMYLY